MILLRLRTQASTFSFFQRVLAITKKRFFELMPGKEATAVRERFQEVPTLPRETVRTGNSGQADLQFHDKSNLSVGPKSSVRLDKFVYDPNKSTGTVAIQATRGSFRFVTGSQGGSYQIKSPYGTLGIRG